MLELWQQDADIAARPQPQEAHDLPTTFGETFGAAWSQNQLFSQDAFGENDRLSALGDYLDTIKQKTGEDLAPTLDYGGAAGTGFTSAASLLDQANERLAELKKKNPALELEPMTLDQLGQAGIDKRRQADANFADVMGRERGPGATVGAIAGGLAAGLADPINIVALPAAPEEGLGILANALRWAAIAGGTQAASEAIQAPYREEVQPGRLQSGEPLLNVAAAAGVGFLGAGVLRGLGNAWERVKTGAWPTSVRDAGNVVESEANIAGSNIYSGPEGEAAHRAALGKAIDNVLAGLPVRVDKIITPEIEARSRTIMARLEGERAVALPAFDERTIRLISEEAGLRQQHGELGTELEGLPQGDLSAADRLNRLQAVNAQLENASPEMRRALLQRRDQILVDTTPEALQAAAGPIARRQALEAQQGRIAGRLEEIAAERRQIEAENLSSLPQAMIGQTMPVRAAPLEAIRSQAQLARAEADRLRSTLGLEKQPELPFEQMAAEGEAETAHQALASGVQQVARRSGYEMPGDEAREIVAKLLKATPAEAQDLTRDLQMSPRQVAEAPTRLEVPAEPERVGVTPIKEATPELEQALRADLDRELAAQIVKPPDPGFVRFFHGGENPHAGGPRWAAPSAEYARDYRGGPNKVWYVDIPKGDATEAAARLFDELDKGTNMEGRYGNVELPEKWAAQLKPYEPTETKIPVGVDAEGNPIYRSLDAAMNEIDGYKAAAEQIAACAQPAPEEKEAA